MELNMNRSCIVQIVVLALAFGTRLHGQPYNLNWFTIEGGGGTCTGGVYSLSGTVGQPDAGTLSAGRYTVGGGFWGLVAAIQTPGAPVLTIMLTITNTLVISWPSPSTGFTLQEIAILGRANWTDIVQTPADDGTMKSVTVPQPIGSRFYRLKK
jgi:hypothetical protein